MMTVTRKREGGLEPNLGKKGGAKLWKKKYSTATTANGELRDWTAKWTPVLGLRIHSLNVARLSEVRR